MTKSDLSKMFPCMSGNNSNLFQVPLSPEMMRVLTLFAATGKLPPCDASDWHSAKMSLAVLATHGDEQAMALVLSLNNQPHNLPITKLLENAVWFHVHATMDVLTELMSQWEIALNKKL